MSFCKYSTEFVASSQTEVDNIFINDYLPFAPSDYVKVYLFGLYMCKGSSNFDNTLENFAKRLNMTEEDVEKAFIYWEEQGLVQVLKTYPIEIRYIPLKNIVNSTKLYKPEKYECFNSQAQELFSGKREISKTEYGEYYDFLERYHVEQEALLMIMKYCIDTKKSGVGYSYILTVAKNWANEGITTASQVEERLQAFEQKGQEIGLILSTLGIKRGAYIEERNLVNKWLNDFGFNLDVVLYLAKNLKQKGRGNFNALDGLLSHYYEIKLFSIMEIEEFEKNKKELYELAKAINKAIGVYYESLDSEVENYILKWINLGFDKEVLLEIASYCFKNSIRTLEGMDNTLLKFYKKGIISLQAFADYCTVILDTDKQIQSILEKLGLSRKVSFLDRENYKTWTQTWGINQELLDYGVALSQDKNMPMLYLSKVLASWHERGITTKEEAEKSTLPSSPNTQTHKNENFKGRSYEGLDVNALFQSIDEIEI